MNDLAGGNNLVAFCKGERQDRLLFGSRGQLKEVLQDPSLPHASRKLKNPDFF